MTDLQWFVLIAWWLALGTALFGVFERKGLKAGSASPVHTLSRAVWDLFQAFPLAVIAGALEFGLVVGGLLVHFFWHWCPPGSVGVGLLQALH